VYLLISVSLLSLLSRRFLHFFLTVLAVILHNFPYCYETEMTDRMDNGSATRPDIRNHFDHADEAAELNRSVRLELLIGVVNWRHKALLERGESCKLYHDGHVVDLLNRAAQPRLRSLRHPDTVSHTCG